MLEIGEEQYNDLVEDNNNLIEKNIQLQMENEKQKEILDICKKVFLNDYVDTLSLTIEEYETLKEWWLEND